MFIIGTDDFVVYRKNSQNSEPYRIPNWVIVTIGETLEQDGIFFEDSIKNYNLYYQLQYCNSEIIAEVKRSFNLHNILCSGAMTNQGCMYFLYTYDEENSISHKKISKLVKDRYQ